MSVFEAGMAGPHIYWPIIQKDSLHIGCLAIQLFYFVWILWGLRADTCLTLNWYNLTWLKTSEVETLKQNIFLLHFSENVQLMLKCWILNIFNIFLKLNLKCKSFHTNFSWCFWTMWFSCVYLLCGAWKSLFCVEILRYSQAFFFLGGGQLC